MCGFICTPPIQAYLIPSDSRGYSHHPNEGISVSSYVESLTGTGFLEMLENSRGVLVHASMLKFEFENNINMNAVLISLGIPDAFLKTLFAL